MAILDEENRARVPRGIALSRPAFMREDITGGRTIPQLVGKGIKSLVTDVAPAVAGTVRDVATIVPRSIEHVGREIASGYTGAPFEDTFQVFPTGAGGAQVPQGILPARTRPQERAAQVIESRPVVTGFEMGQPTQRDTGLMGGYTPEGTRIVPSGTQGDVAALRSPAPTWADEHQQWLARQPRQRVYSGVGGGSTPQPINTFGDIMRVKRGMAQQRLDTAAQRAAGATAESAARLGIGRQQAATEAEKIALEREGLPSQIALREAQAAKAAQPTTPTPHYGQIESITKGGITQEPYVIVPEEGGGFRRETPRIAGAGGQQAGAVPPVAERIIGEYYDIPGKGEFRWTGTDWEQ